MRNVYFIADRSATQRGWVGLVVDTSSQEVVSRTPSVYTDATLAQTAARAMWSLKQQDNAPAYLAVAVGGAA